MKAIAYLRVSSKEQGESGLGLESQQKDIEQFSKANHIELVQIVREVKSAKGDLESRPLLIEVIETCRQEKCALIVSKLDRLSRDVHAVSGLMRQPIRFIVVQLGLEADNFQLHLFAGLAEKERAFISQRTKAALQAKKERGESLGNLQGLVQARPKGLKVRKSNANEFALKMGKDILEWFERGEKLSGIADRLNRLGVKTVRGGKWQATSVKRIISNLNGQTCEL
jgi:DNA invertase Pin-like site-specific DNA recombinase